VINIAQRHANYQLGMGISVADENRFYTEAGKNVVVLGPYGQNAHAAYEWVSISSLYKIRDIYCDILKYAADIINL
jgi:acetylornithine deacetylase/succinyl-diaminopimelate desuccinylase-like protein